MFTQIPAQKSEESVQLPDVNILIMTEYSSGKARTKLRWHYNKRKTASRNDEKSIYSVESDCILHSPGFLGGARSISVIFVLGNRAVLPAEVQALPSLTVEDGADRCCVTRPLIENPARLVRRNVQVQGNGGKHVTPVLHPVESQIVCSRDETTNNSDSVS